MGGESKTDEIFPVDLDEILWSMGFRCPRCGEPIFPEEKIGERFDLLEVEFKEREMQGAIIRCTTCGSVIRMVGLGLLNRIGCFDKS